MSYTATDARKFVGRSVGEGHGVAFARAAAGMPHTGAWKRGAPVRGAALAPGTAIATFDKNGRYANNTNGKSHAAIYLGQSATGIRVLDQWLRPGHQPDGTITKEPVAVHERTIPFSVDDRTVYYVVE